MAQDRALGASGVRVSGLGLGGYWLGDSDPDTALAVVEASAAAGVDWVDTAEGYFDGANETNLAPALRAAPSMQVSSKVSPWRSTPTAAGVREACVASLRRLGRDVLDVYFVHAPVAEVPLEETWGAMSGLVSEGLVRAIGLSNFSFDDVCRAHQMRPVDVVQDGLSMIDNLSARGHFAACAELNIAGVVYEPLANGLLTGAITAESDLSSQREWPAIFERLFAPGRFERSLEVAGRLRELAAAWGYGLPQLAIAWCAHQVGVTSVLAGTADVGHARTNAAAAAISLTTQQLADLDALIPLGPAFG